ncbi:hypothetical protein CJ030_MR4G006410 [Morella rubra]|uniref:Uncharacterized protein n=1 Tax=Morella rubra TaxID=262757 RepID=A0A6A1VT80_9ROSI|nr:hypothetical protein CJ030_MR4G006410 [Morella rubra]
MYKPQGWRRIGGRCSSRGWRETQVSESTREEPRPRQPFRMGGRVENEHEVVERWLREESNHGDDDHARTEDGVGGSRYREERPYGRTYEDARRCHSKFLATSQAKQEQRASRQRSAMTKDGHYQWRSTTNPTSARWGMKEEGLWSQRSTTTHEGASGGSATLDGGGQRQDPNIHGGIVKD